MVKVNQLNQVKGAPVQTEQLEEVRWYGDLIQVITQPISGSGKINHFKCERRLTYHMSEGIVESLGGRLLTLEEA